jgi:hypothetical protein
MKMKKLGAAMLGNPTDKAIRASLRLDVLDSRGRPIDPQRGSLRITLEGAALEKFRRLQADRPVWEDMGDGSFAVLDPATAMPELTLQPGETLPLGLWYALDRRDRGYAVRATQYEREGALRRLVGGQTFVVGEVAGFTSRPRPLGKDAAWRWVVASGALLLLIAVLAGSTPDRLRGHR